MVAYNHHDRGGETVTDWTLRDELRILADSLHDRAEEEYNKWGGTDYGLGCACGLDCAVNRIRDILTRSPALPITPWEDVCKTVNVPLTGKVLDALKVQT